MKLRTKSTGYRQAAWDALRLERFASVQTLAERIDCAPSGLRNYVRGLETNGYINRADDGQIELVKNTGARAPSFNINTGDFRDWNTDPTMTGERLSAIVSASGLTISAWLTEIGHHPAEMTRFRQMMNGQRPVSQPISDAAEKYAAEHLKGAKT